MSCTCSVYGVKGEAYAVLMKKPEGTQRLGRSRHSLENDIKMGLEEMGYEGVNWIDLVAGRHN